MTISSRPPNQQAQGLVDKSDGQPRVGVHIPDASRQRGRDRHGVRTPDGNKFAVENPGLAVLRWRAASHDVYVAEGPTNTLALHQIGLPAVGRRPATVVGFSSPRCCAGSMTL